ncbi:hypothetical protein MTO96_038962, partial [Rhipicephalus appendiculatus]
MFALLLGGSAPLVTEERRRGSPLVNSSGGNIAKDSEVLGVIERPSSAGNSKPGG